MTLILRYVVGLILAFYILNQVRKPSRWVGRFFTWVMNKSHSSLTDWGLTHVTVAKNHVILDVGCGGGRTIEKLAAVATEGKVYGVDYAKGSVSASRAKNAASIAAGRVDVREGSVSQLPFESGTFDLATAVETQYYWPNLEGDMREILRVLKPGGTLIVIAESYRGGRFDWLQGPVLKLLRSTPLTPEQNQQLSSAAGFTGVQVFTNPDKGWICVRGEKPA